MKIESIYLLIGLALAASNTVHNEFPDNCDQATDHKSDPY